MAYTALYRKFRPSEFDDVKGQEPIVTTLKNQVKAGRIGHAYLFCGTRGTGKTTVAKIFAKAVNCEDPADGSPCGKCASCMAVAAGTSMNVIEIDAASNNGVDNIREIRDEVSYSPTEGRFKVYIIDEAHMLSIGAFNALLKTLEEPPSYVIFILATTEPHKIPLTILSRCQRYDFRRISVDTIYDRLEELAVREGVEAEERALRYIAKAADGSMRDALSLLDQCIAFYLGQKLTYDNVLEVLGATDTDVFSALFRAINEKDVAGAIRLLEEEVMRGRELRQFVIDFTWYLRNLLLIGSADGIEDVLDVSGENLETLKEEAAMARPETLTRYIRVFSELSSQIRYSLQKRILIEIAIIKLCRPAMESDISSLAQRVDDLEKKIEGGQYVPATPGPGPSGEKAKVADPARQRQALPDDIQKLIEKWGEILADLDAPVCIYLRKARLYHGGGDVLQIVLDDQLAAASLNNERHIAEIESAIEKNIGKRVEIEIKADADGQRDGGIDPESLIQMDIELEEDAGGGF